MEGFFVLLGLLLLAVPFVALGLAVAARNHAERLEEQNKALHKRLMRLEQSLMQPGHAAPPAPMETKREAAAATPEPPAAPSKSPVIETPAPPAEVIELTPVPEAPMKERSEVEKLVATLSAAEAAAPVTIKPLTETVVKKTEGGAAVRPPAKEKDTPRVGWEEKLGAKLPVWIGAIALALAGIFMVRLMVQHGMLTPIVRVWLTVGFGAALIGIGEFVRRNLSQIAQGLTAAGVAVLYASLVSAVNLHHLMEPTTGFALMASVTALAVALSLRHGPFVAVLGLVGGFVMPAILGAHHVSTLHLFSYLLLLEIGLTLLTRGRGWWWLTLLTMIGGFGWAVFWINFWFNADDASMVALFVMASVASFVIASFNCTKLYGEMPVFIVMPYLSVIAGLGLIGQLVHASSFTPSEWSYLMLLGAGCIVLGRARDEYLAMPWLSAATGTALLILWANDGGAHDGLLFKKVVLAHGLLYGIGAYAAMIRTHRPAVWAYMSIVSAMTFTFTAYLADDPDFSLTALPWWSVFALLAGLYTLGAIPVGVVRERCEGDTWDSPMGGLIIGISAMAATALAIRYEQRPLTIALAIEVFIVAAVMYRLKLPELKRVVTVLAGVVAVRLLINPMIVDYPLSEHVIFNGLWILYGLPLLSFIGASKLMRRFGDEPRATGLEAGAIAFGFALVSLLIRHGFDPHMTHHAIDLIEFSTYTTSWLALGIALLIASARWKQPAVRIGARVVLVLGVLVLVIGAGLFRNPLSSPAPIGEGVLINVLWYVYGMPAILLGLTAWVFAKQKDEPASHISLFGSIALLVVTAGMLIHHGYHPADMTERGASLYEYATYGLAWGVMGLGLMTIGGRVKHELVERFGDGLALMSVVAVIVGGAFAANPLHVDANIGNMPVFNGLLYIFALPALIAGTIAYRWKQRGYLMPARAMALGALVLIFALVSLQVRQSFWGAHLILRGQAPTMGEWYAYSAAWLAYAAVLLTVGVLGNLQMIRYASLAVMLVSVVKVFIFDTRHLSDLWRVLSFLGLGVSLLLLAWVYQRFVFRSGARTRETDEQSHESDGLDEPSVP
ncbi:MAG: DUF2339 domain-containing protein [Planctomycetes bacterium]|nr:DUF2339 domain-containing protein [Planctomycetota bacterium]